LVTETQQGQTQDEKTIVKTATVENISINEPEVNTQTPNTILDIDTLIAPEIPNTFTPGDDDNLNKEFVIKIDNESTYRLRVFDSKANLVFESFKKEIRWNGQHLKSGENCESGNYFYIFDYQYKCAKELRQKSGNILLTRYEKY
jgi:gliding motility-associated-like protein